MAGNIKLIIDQFVKRFWYFLCAVPLLLQTIFHIINNGIIDYDYVHELDVKIHIFGRNFFQDKKIIVIIRTFKPDIIHCWDNIACLHFGPIAKFYGIPFLNSSISAAPSKMPIYSKRLWATVLTYPFSDIILANLKAGLISYRVPAKKAKLSITV